MTTSVATGLIGDLILARLLASAKKPPALAKVRTDLERYFAQPLAAESWQECVDQLISAGLITPRPGRLTDAGRAQALEFLGTKTLPQRLDWKTIRNRYLVPKALGLPAGAEASKVVKAEGLGTHLVRTNYELAVGPNATLTGVMNALVFKELGFPEETTFAGLKRAVLSRLLGASDKLKLDAIKKQLPKQVVGAHRGGVDALREAILRRWLGDASEEARTARTNGRTADAAPFDLPAFAATVLAVARGCPTGRFGDNKVFISHVWRQFRQEPGMPPLDLDAFKLRLAEANHVGLLQLSRADLVQVMDPIDVREAATPYLDAVFHFVLTQEDRP
jgi:hypothetical protein